MKRNIVKKIAFIISLIVISVLFVKISIYDDYYLNETNKVSYENGEYICYQTYNLLPGEYNLMFDYETEESFVVDVVSIDTAQVLASKTISADNNCDSIDFSINVLSKGVKLVVQSDLDSISFKDASYKSYQAVYNDRYFLLAIFYIFIAFMYFLYKKQDNNLLIACSFALFVSLPLISDQLPFGHDLYFHIDRIFNTGMQISKECLIPRINETSINSLGSITPMMYPELMIYVPGLMSYLGASAMLGYKLLVIVTNFATSFIANFTVNKVFNKKIALLFTFLYMFNPYRLNEIFVRAALGELLGMAFIPLAFYGLYLLIQDDYKKGFFVSIIIISLIFQSHILSTYIFLIFGLIYGITYVLFNFKTFFADKKRVICIFFAALMTVLLNGYFLLPFLKYYNPNFWISSEYNYLAADSGILYRLFANVYNVENSKYGMPISIGNGMLIGVFVTIYLLITKKDFQNKNACICTLIVGLFAVLLATPFFPWGHIQSIKLLDSLVGIFQFPWRFQMLAAMFLSLSVAITLNSLSEKENYLRIIIIIMCLISALNTMNGYIDVNPILMENKSDDYKQAENLDYYRRDDNIKVTSKMIQNRVFISDSNASFSYSQSESKHVVQYNNLNTKTNVQIPVYYYENLYNVTINGENVPYRCGEYNMVELSLDAKNMSGEIVIEVNKKQFLLGDTLSGLSIVLIVVLYIRYKKEEKSISSK